jgi:tetratricopeptide (TPR) repeat protein
METSPSNVGQALPPVHSWRLLSALALVLITLAAYANSFDSGFVVDNRGLILQDPRVHEATPENIRLILDHTYWWPNGDIDFYRPITTFSWLFNYAILGNRERPAGYHWINFLLHAGNVLLVYALSMRFMRKRWPAFFVPAIWAVHPVLTESVTNMAGRADLLAAGAVLGGLLLYLKGVEAQGWRRMAWLAGLLLTTTIGVFSKESAVILPAAIVLYELTFRGFRWPGRAQLMGLLATLAPIAFMFYERSHVFAGITQTPVPFTDDPIVGANFLVAKLTALDVIARDFWLIVWPARLSADYSYAQIPLAQGSLRDWIVALAVCALVPATVFLYRLSRVAFFFFCLGLIWLAPASNLLVPVSIMGERFLYIPVLGVVACLVPAVYALAERTQVARYVPVALCLLIAALAARTWVRNTDWRDDLSIAQASVQASPRSYKTHDMLANALLNADPSHANIDRVIEESEKSRALLEPLPDTDKPAHPYIFAATCYAQRGDYPKAITVLRQFVTVEQASPSHINDLRQAYGYMMLAAAYIKTGDKNQAADAADHARALDTLNPKVYMQLAEIYATSNRMDDAFISLAEGEFVTADAGLMDAWVDLYRRAAGPASCALQPTLEGPALNPPCPIVHAHVCAASAYVVKTLAAAGQQDVALARKQMFIENFHCRVE